VVYGNLIEQNETTTQSHELRLAGDVGAVHYQVGGFMFKQSVDSLTGFYLGDITPGNTNFGLFINYNLRDSDNESKSAFGQVEWAFTDQLTAVGGVRYTSNDNEGFWRDRAAFLVGPETRPRDTPNIFGPPELLSSSEEKTTWLVGLNYKLTPDTLLYGKVSTGFKGGGFDSVGTYGPEENTAYETGLKKTFDGGRGMFNAAAFYYDYTGLQVDVLLSSAEGGRTFNAGAATIWGVELEGAFELTENDHVSASLNYLNAKLDELFALYNVYCVPIAEGGVGTCSGNEAAVGDLDPNTPGVQSPNFGGNTPGNSPEWIGQLAYDHVFRLASGNTLTLRADTTYKSEYFTQFYNYEDMKQDAYTQSNAAIEFATQGGLTISAYVRNIEDKRYLTNAYFLAAGPDDIWNFQFGNPRQYGLRFSKDW
jgi:iron complex outermembrane receptor protein